MLDEQIKELTQKGYSVSFLQGTKDFPLTGKYLFYRVTINKKEKIISSCDSKNSFSEAFKIAALELKAQEELDKMLK